MTFFNRGVTRAFVIADHTFSVRSEALTILHSIRARTFTDLFSNHAGIGSDVHCIDGDFLTNVLISSMVTAAKVESLDTATLSKQCGLLSLLCLRRL